MDRNSHTALHWIMVSPHPDDVITIYSCLPNDAELSDIYCQPSIAEIQHLIYSMGTPKYRWTRSLPMIRNATNYARYFRIQRTPYNSEEKLYYAIMPQR